MVLPPQIRGARAAFVFFTRLPLGGFPYRDEDYAWAPAHAPLVGAVVGGLGASAFVLTAGAGPTAAALVAVAVTALITGGFHEDGLADTADALGGAIFDRDRLLEILKDSRIGTYGALALVLSVGLRVALVAQLAASSVFGFQPAVAGAVALVISHVVARVAPTWLMAALPYVTDAAHARSRPVVRAARGQALVATLWALLFTGALAWRVPAAAPVLLPLLAVVPLVALSCAWRFHRRAGGITGDFLGATEQVGELAVLLCLALAS